MPDKKHRILVVEDEGPLSFFISRTLQEDYEIVAVGTGEDAIRKWNEKPYDMLVTDIRLPGISGLELIAQLQANYPDVKSIIVTAYDSFELREKIKNIPGVIAFLPKPFSMENLKKLIKEYFESL